jgi:hypothetical protein
MSKIDSELELLEKRKAELLAAKERELLEKKHCKIKTIFIPGIITITEPKIVDSCFKCSRMQNISGEGYMDDYEVCGAGAGKIYGRNHPTGASFPLTCPYLGDSKERYIKDIEKQ